MLSQCKLLAYFCLILMILCNGLSLESFNTSISVLCSIQQSTYSFDSWLLINARLIYKLNSTTSINQILIENIASAENRYSIAIYTRSQHKKFKLIGVNDIDIIPNSSSKLEQYKTNIVTIDYNKPFATLSTPSLSTYYTTINYYVAMAWQNITYNMKQLNMDTNNVPNFESVIRSDDNITIYDLNAKWEYTINASKYNSSIKSVQQMHGYPQEAPLTSSNDFGYYCLYRNPDNASFIVPDCPNAISVIKEHSKMLYSSGIDVIIPDDTNLDGGPDDIKSYVLQIRPNQLIFETYNQLKKNGSNVPFISIWNIANGVQWKTNLEFYNNYTNLIFTGGTSKKIYFIVNNSKHPPNQTVVSQIEYNGGNNDIKCIYMWCAQSMQSLNNGTWTYWQSCKYNGTETQSLETVTECDMDMSKNSYLGTEMAASFRAGARYGSLPLSQATKLNGRTFQLIIKEILYNKPDNVHFPSFNEHHCGSHVLNDNRTWSNGLYKDINRSIFFNENYGSEASRTFEPSKEAGNYYWLLFQSCSRILRMEYYFGSLMNTDNNISICNVENEICCNNLTQYNDIWSLKANDESNYLLSNDINEVKDLMNRNYSEICAVSPYANTSVFCEESVNKLPVNEVHQGPFILYKHGKNPYGMVGSLAVTNISRVPIYRCIDTEKGTNFIANNGSNCDNVADNYKMEYLLGFAAKTPSTAMPRRVMRCINDKGVYYHTIGDECFNTQSNASLLGFAL